MLQVDRGIVLQGLEMLREGLKLVARRYETRTGELKENLARIKPVCLRLLNCPERWAPWLIVRPVESEFLEKWT